jgi:UDP-N-acetylglucosamine pyrophosphorylase
MNNPDIAKVMYTIAGRPMVDYVVDLALHLEAARIIAVVGWQKDAVIEYMISHGRPVHCVEQTPQLGTGHAVMQAGSELDGFEGDVLVLSGDVPLLRNTSVRGLVDSHRRSSVAATVLTAVPDDPSGYGRIMRNGTGHVVGIVEHKDATEEQRRVREINTGIYVFDRERLFEGLGQITPHNIQNEYYLTDVFQYFWTHRLPVGAVVAPDPFEVQGINTPVQLESARAAVVLRPAGS